MQNEDVVAPIGCSECVTEIVSHRRGDIVCGPRIEAVGRVLASFCAGRASDKETAIEIVQAPSMNTQLLRKSNLEVCVDYVLCE